MISNSAIFVTFMKSAYKRNVLVQIKKEWIIRMFFFFPLVLYVKN